jgi:CBS domain-containing protein
MSSGGERRAPPGRPLAVRIRMTMGDRRRAYDATVHCPRRDGTIAAATCLACTDSEGAASGPDGDFLYCSHPSAELAALEELGRQPIFASAADRTPLSSIVTGAVFCVSPDLGLDELAEFLVEHNISGVPVTDERGRPIGVVSKTDLMRGGLREAPSGAPQADLSGHRSGELAGDPPKARARWPRGSVADPPARVADVMMPMAFTLPESATLSQAAALMAFEGIHRVPVVSSDGRVVGVVSSLDLVRWLAVNDGYIAPRTRTLARRGPPDENE